MTSATTGPIAPQWAPKSRRPATSRITVCRSTTANTAMYLPASITLRGVGVVNRRGSVPSRCSSMMLRAGVAAPKSVKNSIMPMSTWPAVFGRCEAEPPGVTGARGSTAILLEAWA